MHKHQNQQILRLSVSHWVCETGEGDRLPRPGEKEGMKGFDYDYLQRIIVVAGLAVVLGLWAAEDAGLLPVTLQTPSSAATALPSLPGAAPVLPGLVLQGVVPASGGEPAMALLGEVGGHPRLVQEGARFNEDIRVDRILADRVVLHWRGSNAPVVVRLATAGVDTPPPQPAPAPRFDPDHLPMPPAGMSAPRPDETLPATRVPMPIDASGPQPGNGLTGPALSGPANGH